MLTVLADDLVRATLLRSRLKSGSRQKPVGRCDANLLLFYLRNARTEDERLRRTQEPRAGHASPSATRQFALTAGDSIAVAGDHLGWQL